MKYDIAFLTNMYPEGCKEYYDDYGFVPGGENITFIQQSFIEGIDIINGEPTHLINKVFIHKQKTCFVPLLKWKHAEIMKTDDVSFSYINKPFLSSNLLFHYSKQYVDQWLVVDHGFAKVMIAYAITNQTLKTLMYIKKKNPAITTVLIVPDLPHNTKTYGKNIFRNIKNRITDYITSCLMQKSSFSIDLYLLFSKHMAPFLGCQGKYMVLEGIATDSFQSVVPNRLYPEYEKVILYSGGLHAKYGLDLLIDAFGLMKGTSFHLVLCGEGDYVPTILYHAQYNPNIHYMGRIEREYLLTLQAGADVLVNPRTNNQIFSDYSFPSKNMEYLSSGIPFVGFKLGGIPDEYDDYISYVEEETPASLAAKLTEVCTYGQNDAVERAQKAKKFVLEHKNKFAQAKMILDGINTLHC